MCQWRAKSSVRYFFTVVISITFGICSLNGDSDFINRSSFNCGDGDDPFACAFVAHSEWKSDAIDGMAYKSDSYGITFGADCLWHLDEKANSSFLYTGVFGGCLNGKFRCITDGSDTTSDTFLGGVFAAIEHTRANHLKIRSEMQSGFAYANNKLHRYYGNKTLVYNYDSTDFFIHCDITPNLLQLRNWQLGPWLAMKCHHLQRKQHVDSPESDVDPVVVPSANQNLLNIILGINGECEFSRADRPDCLLRSYVKVGWSCQPLHCKFEEVFAMHGLDSFLPALWTKDRHYHLVNIGFHYRMNRYLDFSGSWNGTFNKYLESNRVTCCVGYTF
ncbi:MAG: autotransporter outer membrane beta-barrel domain-containing protein [Puniceicoccales bacterium]|jgi:hypothetical protein|nr:autotransporter outer membrane beta-barrel domain-containing protein [Puniceicoccales bacterium]